MKDDFLDFVEDYKKDPSKDLKRKEKRIQKNKNKPHKNLFNFKFWEWMG